MVCTTINAVVGEDMTPAQKLQVFETIVVGGLVQIHTNEENTWLTVDHIDGNTFAGHTDVVDGSRILRVALTT